MYAQYASHNNLIAFLTTHHPKFCIHTALQLVGLTTEKLLPTALRFDRGFCGYDVSVMTPTAEPKNYLYYAACEVDCEF